MEITIIAFIVDVREHITFKSNEIDGWKKQTVKLELLSFPSFLSILK